MPATPSAVNRTDHPTSGDDFKVYPDSNPTPRLVQAIVNDPDVGGRLLSWATTPGAAATKFLVASTAAGAIFKVDVIMDPTVVGDRYLLVIDKATAPVNTDDPIIRARISGGFASIDLGLYGHEVTSGVSVAISTTPGLLTLPGANEGYFQVGYV